MKTRVKLKPNFLELVVRHIKNEEDKAMHIKFFNKYRTETLKVIRTVSVGDDPKLYELKVDDSEMDLIRSDFFNVVTLVVRKTKRLTTKTGVECCKQYNTLECKDLSFNCGICPVLNEAFEKLRLYENGEQKYNIRNRINETCDQISQDQAIIIALEELAELQQTLTKVLREKGNMDNIHQEYADVIIGTRWIFRKLGLKRKKTEKWLDNKLIIIESKLQGGNFK